ncbi:Protein-tyrosine phosphatase mitochondrial 1 [Musa troglodytarum]|uniref:Protein-tyrosine phosphatase mitochondrial 1 n=1 Tax=Musa troglodytarum TaxID=320322 RepID=A0A9E7JA91_9LILI|nr:Protein-tyrosine phosphatase mitochondrial 1 [Musa troglodytarum]
MSPHSCTSAFTATLRCPLPLIVLVSERRNREWVPLWPRGMGSPKLMSILIRNKIEAQFHWWDEVDQPKRVCSWWLCSHFHTDHVILRFSSYCLELFRSQAMSLVKQLGVRGVITLNQPYETLVPSSLYQKYKFALINARRLISES